LWKGDINGKEYQHSRVYKISGDRFYALLSGQDNALLSLYQALPFAIKDYLKSIEKVDDNKANYALDEIKLEVKKSNRSIIDQITFENYSYYLGFENL
jgi:hypothetical protein